MGCDSDMRCGYSGERAVSWRNSDTRCRYEGGRGHLGRDSDMRCGYSSERGLIIATATRGVVMKAAEVTWGAIAT